MKKTILLFLAIAAFAILFAFKTNDKEQEILTLRVSERFQMSGALWKSEIIVIEPNNEAIVKSELGNLPKDNLSNS